MYEYYPLIVVGAIVGLFSLVLLIAYLTVKDKKQTMGFERQIGDREIMGRLRWGLLWTLGYWLFWGRLLH